MQFSTLTTILSLAVFALATPTPVEPRAPQAPAETPANNANRPVPTGACCVANTSLRQDVCTDASGASGRCVPSGSAGCKFSIFFFCPFPAIFPRKMRTRMLINFVSHP